MLANYVPKFRDLRVDLAHGSPRMHKPCMLLVAIDFAENGALFENGIRYEDTRERFRAYGAVVRPGQDMKPYLPFYHLKSSGFWDLVVKKGAQAPTKARHGQLVQLVGVSARLEAELHRLLVESPGARERLRYVLIERWFPEKRPEVETLITQWARSLSKC